MSELLAAGIQLMLAGMGTVFAFLTLLVFATMGMSALVQRFAPIADEAPAAGFPTGDSGPVPPAHVAAIGAALARHRQRSRSE